MSIDRFYVVPENNSISIVDGRTGRYVETLRYHTRPADYGGTERAIEQARRACEQLNQQDRAGTLPT